MRSGPCESFGFQHFRASGSHLDISRLPPELLRKGRFDEIFFVDLPTEAVRAEILSIHLRKRKLLVEDFDIAAIA
jgi:SpoVK/Ycf46/Vps4 family AAA+-type ATPase